MKNYVLLSFIFLLLVVNISFSEPSVVSVSGTNGFYNAGDVIEIDVTFNETVDVDTTGGTPRFLLDMDGTDKYANYNSNVDSVGNDFIATFTYSIIAGDNADDLDYNDTAIELNGGEIEDSTSNSQDATLTLPTPGTTGSLSQTSDIKIDTTAPTLTNAVATVANQITLTFSESVVTAGSLADFYNRFTITGTASSISVSSFTHNSGTIVLNLNNNILSTDSPSISYSSGIYLTDIAGNRVASTSRTVTNSVPDTIAPVIINVTSNSGAVTKKINDTIDIYIIFDETVTVTGTPKLLLELGDNDMNATYSSGSGSDNLTFSYNVTAGDVSDDLNYNATALALDGGTIKDSATTPNNANLTLPLTTSPDSLAANAAITVDGVVPTVVNVTNGSTIISNIYNIDDELLIDVEFSETVLVTNGVPKLELNLQDDNVNATYHSGSNSDTLRFNYTVGPGEFTSSPTLDYQSTGSLHLDGSNIKDAAGNDANITLAAPSAAGSLRASNIRIDGSQSKPTSVTGVDGTYGIDQNIDITVVFSSDVSINTNGGIPKLLLNLGTNGENATYHSGNNSRNLIFRYTVVEDDVASDLNYRSTRALELNGGTITTNSNGNAVNLELPLLTGSSNLAANNNIVVDGIVPEISSIAAASTTEINLTASEDVFNNSLAANVNGIFNHFTIGGVASNPSVSGISISETLIVLTLNDTILDSDTSPTVSYTATTGQSIDDAGGNSLDDFTMNVNNGLDTTRPTITSVSSGFQNAFVAAPNNNNYPKIDVVFSEPIFVTGTPNLLLNVTSTGRNASYNPPNDDAMSLTFDFIPIAGDFSSDLAYQSINALTLANSSVTIKDAAGNNANLILPIPGEAGSLSVNENIRVDGISPTIVNITGTNGTYAVNDTVNIYIKFSENVRYQRTQDLNISLSTGKNISINTGGGSDTLTFVYTVGEGDESSDLNISSIIGNTTVHNNIRDNIHPGNHVFNNVANLSTSNILSLADNNDIVIDGIEPKVTSILKNSSTRIDLILSENNISINSADPSDFTIGGVTSTIRVTSIQINGNVVTLVLNDSILDSDSPTVSYSKGTGSIEDEFGNDLQSFASRNVYDRPEDINIPYILETITDNTDGFTGFPGSFNEFTIEEINGERFVFLTDSRQSKSVYAINITNLSDPTLLDITILGSGPGDIESSSVIDVVNINSESYIFTASAGSGQSGGFYIHNVSNFSDISYIGLLQVDLEQGDVNSPSNTIEFIEINSVPYIISSTDNAFSIYDISTVSVPSQSNPTIPSIVNEANGSGGFNTLGGIKDVATFNVGSNVYAIVTASTDDGVQIIDITDPTTPVALSSAVDGTNGFDKLDGANGVETFNIGSSVYAIVASTTDDGVQIIDITDPTAPVALFSAVDGANGFDKLDNVSEVEVIETYNRTYAVLSSPEGVTVIDLENPAAPQLAYNIDVKAENNIGTFIDNEKIYAVTTDTDIFNILYLSDVVVLDEPETVSRSAAPAITIPFIGTINVPSEPVVNEPAVSEPSTSSRSSSPTIIESAGTAVMSVVTTVSGTISGFIGWIIDLLPF